MYSIQTLSAQGWSTRYYMILGLSEARKVESDLILSGQLARIVEVA